MLQDLFRPPLFDLGGRPGFDFGGTVPASTEEPLNLMVCKGEIYLYFTLNTLYIKFTNFNVVVRGVEVETGFRG